MGKETKYFCTEDNCEVLASDVYCWKKGCKLEDTRTFITTNAEFITALSDASNAVINLIQTTETYVDAKMGLQSVVKALVKSFDTNQIAEFKANVVKWLEIENKVK